MTNIMLGNISNSWFLIAYILFNMFGFLCMWFDKRAAIKGNYRISERFLLMVAFLGAVIGVWLGMLVFHHKTKKKNFMFGLPLIFFVHLVLLYYFNSRIYFQLIIFFLLRID